MWKLQQYGPQPVRRLQRFKAGVNGAFIFSSSSCFMRELLPHFCRKDEPGIRLDLRSPLRGRRGTQRLVKRSIDLDRIEISRKKAWRAELSRSPRRVRDAGPIGVGPSSRPYKNFVR